VGRALAAAAARLERAGVPAARHDAEVLLARCLGTDAAGLLARRGDPLSGDAAARFAEHLGRRERREPLQHVTGEQEFYGRAFRADRRALVPRPETEGVVDACLALAPPHAARLADLGTGCGCIAVTLVLALPGGEAFALDLSAEALDLARENARRHGVEGRIRFARGDMAAPPEEWLGRMDLVAANPPYVSEEEWEALEPEVRDHDPRAALVAGPTGLEAYAALLPAASGLLRPGGHLVLELGCGQDRAVRSLAASAGFEIVEVLPDLRGIPRVLVCGHRGR
jgi:release factor glutamine methyltransferase